MANGQTLDHHAKVRVGEKVKIYWGWSQRCSVLLRNVTSAVDFSDCSGVD